MENDTRLRLVARKLAIGLVAVLVLAMLGIGVVSWEAADRMVHPPRQLSAATPASRGLQYEAVGFATTDGWALRGWWIPGDAGAPVIVFLHGYGASKAQVLSVAPFLHRAGYSVFAFDFRAHGESEGDHTTLGLEETRDVKAALAWLAGRSDVDASRVALFGWSMGAATALLAGPLLGVRAIVADSSFAALDDVAYRVVPATTHLPPFPFATLSLLIASWEVGHQTSEARPEDAARVLDLPLFIIQGMDDDVARDSDGEALHKAAKNSVLWLVPHARHTGARHADPAGYETRVLAFLKTSFADDSIEPTTRMLSSATTS